MPDTLVSFAPNPFMGAYSHFDGDELIFIRIDDVVVMEEARSPAGMEREGYLLIHFHMRNGNDFYGSIPRTAWA